MSADASYNPYLWGALVVAFCVCGYVIAELNFKFRYYRARLKREREISASFFEVVNNLKLGGQSHEAPVVIVPAEKLPTCISEQIKESALVSVITCGEERLYALAEVPTLKEQLKFSKEKGQGK